MTLTIYLVTAFAAGFLMGLLLMRDAREEELRQAKEQQKQASWLLREMNCRKKQIFDLKIGDKELPTL